MKPPLTAISTSMTPHPATHTTTARHVVVKSSACRTASTIATSIQIATASRSRSLSSPGTMPSTRSTPGGRREAGGSEQLPHIGARLGLREDLGAEDVDQDGPDEPAEQRPQGADDEVRALAPRQADTASHA